MPAAGRQWTQQPTRAAPNSQATSYAATDRNRGEVGGLGLPGRTSATRMLKSGGRHVPADYFAVILPGEGKWYN